MKKSVNKDSEKNELIRKDISILYLNQFIRGLGFSLVGIFIPIYMLTLGYTLNYVLWYFLVFHLVTFIFIPVALLMSKKIGYKPLIIMSVILVIISLIFLRLLEDFGIPIWFVALFWGIENAFYFVPLHGFFIRLTEDKKRGTQYSNYAAFGMLAGLIGPLIGALIATILGFKFLFYVVIFFLIISILPLFKFKNIKPNTKLSFKGIWNLTKTHKKYFCATIADDIKGEAEGIIWPIFVYLTLQSLVSVGWVSFFVSAGTILFTLFLGRHYDKKGKYFFLKLGGLLYALVWFVRLYSNDSWMLYGLSLLAGIFVLMINIPFNTIFYDKAGEHKDPDEFIIFREIPKTIARLFLWILLILLTEKFIVAFVLAGIVSLFFLLYHFENAEKKK